MNIIKSSLRKLSPQFLALYKSKTQFRKICSFCCEAITEFVQTRKFTIANKRNFGQHKFRKNKRIIHLL